MLKLEGLFRNMPMLLVYNGFPACCIRLKVDSKPKKLTPKPTVGPANTQRKSSRVASGALFCQKTEKLQTHLLSSKQAKPYSFEEALQRTRSKLASLIDGELGVV